MRQRLLLASTVAVVTGAAVLAAAAGQSGTAAAARAGPAMVAQTAQSAQGPAAFCNGPAAVLASMSEQQRVGQLFMAGNPAAGPVSSAISTDISTYHTGSVVLTGRSSAGVVATGQLTGQLQSLATSVATDNVPLFVATDQEGGNVQVLSGAGFATMSTALSQGSETPAQLRQNAYTWGSQLAAAGVNLDLAPVLDTVPQNLAATNQPIGIYQREYGYTPAAVTAAGMAFIQGMHEAGVGTVIKHFPGLGRASGNTDTTYGVTDNVTTYADSYLQPYATAVSSFGIQGVMVSEAIYPQIDPSQQAVFSPTVIGGMLRTELGFSGMIVSDSMEATAVSELTPAQQAVDFITAGGDLVLATDPTVIPAMYAAVLAQAQSDPSFATLVNQAALTVLTAKQARTAAPTALDCSGALAVYTVRSDGSVWTDAQPAGGGAFSGWQQLPAAAVAFTGTPAVLQAANGTVAVYVRTTAGTIMGTSQTTVGGAFGPWGQLGTATNLTGDPVALIAGNGAVAIYATDSAGAVEGISQSVQYGAFGSWQVLSPADAFGGRPAVLMTGSGLVAMYARTMAGTLLATSQHARFGAFSPWSQIGSAASLAGDPVALIAGNGAVAVYASDSGGVVEGISQSVAFGPFGSWQALSPADGFAGRPAVLMTSGGLVAMYARTTAGTLVATSQNALFGPFSPWSQIGTATDLAGDPAALITAAGTVAIFAGDSAGGVSWISQAVPFGPFGSWTQL